MLEPGRQLLHYRLIKKIGEGGMGVVWKAVDTILNRQVAIKVLPEALAADPDRRARFEREARAVASLNHPNIVTLYSVEEADPSAGSVHFITMELVEGQTLSKMLPRNGFTLSQLLEIAVPLADAVSRAHRAGITHRDLKPDNIMVDTEGRLRVLDFGLAKLRDPSGAEGGTLAATATAVTEEGKILGTVAYMSPEQAEGKEVDPRSDIFSLGTILYEMVSGTRPFQGDTKVSTISAILKDEPASVTELRPTLPNHLGRIIRRCLAKEPDRRYETAIGLRNELEDLKAEIDSGEGQDATARFTRSTRHWALFGIVAVIGIAAIFVVAQWTKSVPPPTAYTPRPITSALGRANTLNWSPESEFIAFGQVRDGSYDVMVQPVAGGPAEVRAGGPGDQMSPRWSPDGRYLAYVSSYEPGSYVYLVPPHGGTHIKLIATDIPTLHNAKLAPSMGDHPWSPDSRTLLVSRVADSGQTAIYRVERESGESERLTAPPAGNEDLSASYSFDGERIVFERRVGGEGTLLIMPSAGGDPELLLADRFNNSAPAWRPDNRHVVFRSDRGGITPNLWEIDTSTGVMSLLIEDINDLTSFSVSANNRVAYAPTWHDTFLFEVDVTTGERRQLTSHGGHNFGASFSPGGRTVAYHSTRTGNMEIWLHHLDGRPETRITEDRNSDLYPDWSPDGDRLIFVSDRDQDGFKIFIANKDGGGERLLVDRPIAVSSVSTVNVGLVSRWSPAGDRIAFLEANALWTIQPDGEGARELLKNVTGFDWYRDNRRAVYTRPHDSDSEIIAVDLETGQEQVLFVGPVTEIDVAPDGSAVAFCFGRGHQGMGLAVLKLEPPSAPGGLPRALGQPEFVVPAEGTWHVHNGGWSADSKSLVYTHDQDYGDIYELVERQ